MQRYFLQPQEPQDGLVRISGADYHHLAHVMRMRIGERAEVVHGDQAFEAQLVSLDDVKGCAVLCIGTPLAASRESKGSLTLLQGLPKGDKIELIIRQACEIGVSRIVVFEAKRSVACLPKDKLEARLARWRKLAKEACEQAHRDVIVDVLYVASADLAVRTFWDSAQKEALLVIAYESQVDSLPGLRETLFGVTAGRSATAVASEVGIVIGPEGGFDALEITRMKESGGIPVSLGSRILRTETAGLALAAVVMYEWGEWASAGAQ